MPRVFKQKLVFLPLITAILAVFSVMGIKTLAANDIVVFSKLWTAGLPTWQDTISVEPGADFKITLFAGNYSQTAAVASVRIVDNLPANSTFTSGTVFQILNNNGVWQALGDSGTSPFVGTGLNVTDDASLNAQEFANYKYTLHVDDFLPTSTTQLTWAGPTLYFTDTFGNQTKTNINSNAINITNLPSINAFTLTPAKAYYKLGDVITFTLTGTAGKTASAKINGLTVNLTESAPGVYTGTYTVQSGDNFSATPRAYLANANNKGAYKDYTQTVSVDSVVPGAVTGLNGILNADNTVKLIWVAPVDTDINHYNIHSNNGSGNVNYGTVLATVNVGINQYTTAVLNNDALYKFSVRTVDNAGNTETNTTTISKSTDVTPPEAPASLVQPTSLNSQVVKYNASNPIQFSWVSSVASDLVKYRLEIDDNNDFSSIITSQDTVGTTTAYSLQTSAVSLAEGIYFYRVSAIDDADLLSTPATTPDNVFEIDNTAPTVAVSQPATGSQVANNFSISGTAADAGTHLNSTNGLSKVEVFLTNLTTGQHWSGTAWGATATFLTAASTNNFATWSYQFTAPITNGSIYTTGARATDKANNQTDSTLLSLVGDTVVPAINSITLTNTTLGGTAIFKNTNNIVLTATITDNLGQASMGVNNINADLSAITGNAGDNAVVPASYNTANGLATWTAVAGNVATDGAKNVPINATDLAGNAGNASNSITADNTAPAITAATLTSPSAAGLTWKGGSVQNITWNQAQITDANLAANPITLEYTTDGSNYTPIAANEANDGAYAWTVASLDSASVRVRVTAKDNANNTASDQSDNLFTVDSTAPAFSNVVLTNSILSITTLVKNGDTVVLTATITDNLLQALLATGNITADFTNITNNAGDNAVQPTSYNPANGAAVWNFKTTAGTANGNLSLSITATDAAGNAATFTNTAIIVADNAAPTITTATLTAPSASGLIFAGGSAQNITWNQAQITDANLAANPITLEYTTDGSNYTQIATGEANDGTYAWTVPNINSQTVKVRVTAKDGVNNTSNDISDNNFTIDSTVPVVPANALTSPNGGEAWKQGTVKNITWNNAAITDNFALAVNPVT
ncbi:MAG: fibronectin type III domain-containing protein, partial [Patescibacteria group bacterium]